MVAANRSEQQPSVKPTRELPNLFALLVVILDPQLVPSLPSREHIRHDCRYDSRNSGCPKQLRVSPQKVPDSCVHFSQQYT